MLFSLGAIFCSYFCLVCARWGCKKNPEGDSLPEKKIIRILRFVFLEDSWAPLWKGVAIQVVLTFVLHLKANIALKVISISEVKSLGRGFFSLENIENNLQSAKIALSLSEITSKETFENNLARLDLFLKVKSSLASLIYYVFSLKDSLGRGKGRCLRRWVGGLVLN